MSDPSDSDARHTQTGWTRRLHAGLFSGVVGGMVGAAVAGERLRRVLDRRTSSRRFAGTPCSQLPRPDAADDADTTGKGA